MVLMAEVLKFTTTLWYAEIKMIREPFINFVLDYIAIITHQIILFITIL